MIGRIMNSKIQSTQYNNNETSFPYPYTQLNEALFQVLNQVSSLKYLTLFKSNFKA